MIVITLIPMLVCVIGLLIYAFAGNMKLVECGRLAYFAGLFVTLLAMATHVIKMAL